MKYVNHMTTKQILILSITGLSLLVQMLVNINFLTYIWLENFGDVLDPESTASEKYWTAFFFIVITLRGVGYGNYYLYSDGVYISTSDISTGFIMFLIFYGMMYLPLVIAKFKVKASLLNKVSEQMSEEQDEFELWLKTRWETQRKEIASQTACQRNSSTTSHLSTISW